MDNIESSKTDTPANKSQVSRKKESNSMRGEHIRKSLRWRLPLELNIAPCSSSSSAQSSQHISHNCLVKDISKTGTRILTTYNTHYRIGARITLGAKLPKNLKDVINVALPLKPIVCRVMRAVPSEGGLELGILFATQQGWVEDIADHIDPRPISPWLNPELAPKIAQLVSNFASAVPTLERRSVDHWLRQFSKRARPIMLAMLESICMHYSVSEAKCMELVRTLYSMLLDRVQNNLCQMRILCLGRESRGGGIVKYRLRVGNNLPVWIFPESLEVLNREIAAGKVRMVAFIDDFFGTGNTAVRSLQHILQQLSPVESVNVVACALVGFGKAILRVTNAIEEARPRQWGQRSAFAALPLSNEEDCIFVLPPEESLDATRVIHDGEYCEKIFVSREDAQIAYDECLRHSLYVCDGVDRPCGYDNLASPVVFQYNTPNNSLPVFWYAGGLWHPIVPRLSYRDYPTWKLPSKILTASVEKQASKISDRIVRTERGLCFIEGESGTGKSTLASEVAQRLRQDKNIFWYEFTEHTTADCLRNQLEQFVCQGLPGKGLRDQFLGVARREEKDVILQKAIRDLSPVLVFHHVDRMKEPFSHLKTWIHQREELLRFVEDLVNECMKRVWFLFTVNSVENVSDLANEPFDRISTACLDLETVKSSIPEAFVKKGKGSNFVAELLSNPQRSRFSVALSILLSQNDTRAIGAIRKASEEQLLKLFWKKLDKNEHRVALCAAAIRYHRTEGILKTIHNRVYKRKISIHKMSDIVKKLEAKWNPIIFKDMATGYLRMSDRLRSHLFGKAMSRGKRSLFHFAIAETYANLEARDWAERIGYVAVSVDHYLKSSDESILEATKLLRRLRPFFEQYGKIGQFRALVLGVLEEVENRGLDKPGDYASCYLTLSYELRRMFRRQGEFNKIEDLCNKIIHRDDLLPGHEVLFSRFAAIRAALDASSGDYGEAERNSLLAIAYATKVGHRENKSLGSLHSIVEPSAASDIAKHKFRYYLRWAQTEMSWGKYSDSWEHLGELVDELEALKEYKADPASWQHTLTIVARHASTLYYLDSEALHSLRWANVSYSLNKELEDHEGEAVSLIKLSLAWSLLGDRSRSLSTAQQARAILQHYVPKQTWWFLAVEKACCLAYMRCLRRNGKKKATEEFQEDLVKLLEHVQNMRKILKENDNVATWLTPWFLETDVLQAEVCIWNERYDEAERFWKRAWATALNRRQENLNNKGLAPQLRSLCASLGQLTRHKRTVFPWIDENIEVLTRVLPERTRDHLNDPKQASKAKWFHHAILCFIKALDFLTEDRLFHSQEWFLEQIQKIADEVGGHSDEFVHLSKLWASSRLIEMKELTTLGKEMSWASSTSGTNRFCNSHRSLSAAIRTILEYHQLPIRFVSKDDTDEFLRLCALRTETCSKLERMLKPADPISEI